MSSPLGTDRLWVPWARPRSYEKQGREQKENARDKVHFDCPRYFVENLNTVFDLKVSPGFRIVDGNSV